MAAAAPAGAAAGEGAAGAATALGWLVLLAVLYAWRRTLGRLLLELADVLDRAAVSLPLVGTKHLFGPLSGWLRTANAKVDHALALAALTCESATVWLLHQAWNTLVWSVRELAAFSVAVEQAIGLAAYREIPIVVNQIVGPIKRRLRGIDETLGTLEAQAKALAARLARGIDSLTGSLTQQLHAFERRLLRGIDTLTKRVTHALPHEIAGVRTRVGALEKEIAGLRGHAGRIEKLLGAAAIATLVGAALNRLGLRWLRCPNVGKVGKAVCGMNRHLLDDVLGLLADFFVVTNICAVLPLLEHGFETFAAPLVELVGKAGAGLCNASYAPAPRSAPPRLYLPAVTLDLHLPE